MDFNPDCEVEGCEREAMGNPAAPTLCKKHFKQWQDSAPAAEQEGRCMRCGKPTHRWVTVGHVCEECASASAKTLPPRADVASQETGDSLRESQIRYVWNHDAPQGQGWVCPDCNSWATLGGNAGLHAKTTGHRAPSLGAQPVSRASSSTSISVEPKPESVAAQEKPVAASVEVRSLLKYISETPALLSLLYDTNLLPEQTSGTRDYPRTLLIADAWRAALASASWPSATTR